jgi:hypothetical protein
MAKANFVDKQKFYEHLLHRYDTVLSVKKRQQKYYQLVSETQANDNRKSIVNQKIKDLLHRIPIDDYIGECILKICQNLIRKKGFIEFSQTHAEDMIGDAIENCFHRSTKVMTIEHGSIEIEKIVGKEVTVKAKDGVWRKAKVRSYGEQDLYEYTFGAFNVSVEKCFQKVIATKNHRWFVTSRRNNKRHLVSHEGVVTDLRIGDCLENAANIDDMNKDAIIHGLVFGDGSGHKTQVFNGRCVDVQGEKWAKLRVCKQDAVGEEINNILQSSGYKPTFPKSAHGDACYALGNKPYVKDLPYTTDPEYIRGFIYGWWLADGNKTTGHRRNTITTSRRDAAEWLKENACYAGYQVTSFLEKWGNTEFKKNRVLFTIKYAENTTYEPKVRDIKYVGKDEVFCLEEPVTHSFVLGNGLLTGNCILYISSFDPRKSKEPFSYFTQVATWAFVRRIEKEKREVYFKLRSLHNMDGLMDSSFQEEHDDTYDGKIMSDDWLIHTRNYVNEYESKMEKKRKRQRKKKEEKQQILSLERE